MRDEHSGYFRSAEVRFSIKSGRSRPCEFAPALPNGESTRFLTFSRSRLPAVGVYRILPVYDDAQRGSAVDRRGERAARDYQ